MDESAVGVSSRPKTRPLPTFTSPFLKPSIPSFARISGCGTRPSRGRILRPGGPPHCRDSPPLSRSRRQLPRHPSHRYRTSRSATSLTLVDGRRSPENHSNGPLHFNSLARRILESRSSFIQPRPGELHDHSLPSSILNSRRGFQALVCCPGRSHGAPAQNQNLKDRPGTTFPGI